MTAFDLSQDTTSADIPIQLSAPCWDLLTAMVQQLVAQATFPAHMITNAWVCEHSHQPTLLLTIGRQPPATMH